MLAVFSSPKIFFVPMNGEGEKHLPQSGIAKKRTAVIRILPKDFLPFATVEPLKCSIMGIVKGLPYSVARFEQLRNENSYYVDKTRSRGTTTIVLPKSV